MRLLIAITMFFALSPMAMAKCADSRSYWKCVNRCHIQLDVGSSAHGFCVWNCHQDLCFDDSEEDRIKRMNFSSNADNSPEDVFTLDQIWKAKDGQDQAKAHKVRYSSPQAK